MFDACVEEFNPEASKKLFKERFKTLTRVEKEVLTLLAEGRSAKEIAIIRNRSKQTVRTQIKHLLGKVEAGSQIRAVLLAIHLGVVTPNLDSMLQEAA